MNLAPSLRRATLNLATVAALLLAGLLLLGSWFQSTPQTRLDLHQTDLALQAARTLDDPRYQPLAQVLLGPNVIESATNRYAQALKGHQLVRQPTAPTGLNEWDALNLRVGILAAYQEQIDAAQSYWQAVTTADLQPTAAVLLGLWSNPIRILPDAEAKLQRDLDGWFAATALTRLYGLQQRADAVDALTQNQEQEAVSALTRLGLVTGLPLIGILLGVGIGLFWLGWMLAHKRELVGPRWQVPWGQDEVQGVMSGWFLGFLFLGWLVPGLYIAALRVEQLSHPQQALGLFLTYNAEALAGLGLLYLVVRRHRPLPGDLLRVRWLDPWPLWGGLGYLAAMPLVVMAAALSQILLPDLGGGNPILPLILDSQGWGTRLLFLVVVSVCAPIFEEILFRGFLLPSLSHSIPTWGAVGLSALLFAVAHLNCADLLPLTTLGIVLGLIYSHSRNLLASILLHSLWNTGSLLALLILAGG